MDELIDGWINGDMQKWKNGLLQGWVGEMGGMVDKWMGRWIDGMMDREKNLKAWTPHPGAHNHAVAAGLAVERLQCHGLDFRPGSIRRGDPNWPGRRTIHNVFQQGHSQPNHSE
eukprot:scaffold318793_cov39-Prasinocladus_malaysianus.AAC.2